MVAGVSAVLLPSERAGVTGVAGVSFDAPSPSASSLDGRSLLYQPLPSDLLWPVRPASPNAAPVLNIAVNRLQLFRAVDAAVESVVQHGSPQASEVAVSQRGGGRKERAPVGGRQLTVEELVDQQCHTAAAFHYQQQLRLDVEHPPQPAASTASTSRLADTVASLTASSSSAHRYRLYTDSLIDVGLHHEAELRRQWIAMETQARSINRSAERAARRDMRDTVREIVNAAKAGKCNEVRDKVKEATQHVDEANEARNSRAAIYTDEQLYLPLSRSRQREASVVAGMAGEHTTIGHLNARQPLFDPVPQTNEFEQTAQQHVCFHSFRDDDRGGQRNEAAIELPAVVHSMKQRMERVEEEREEERKEQDTLKRLHRTETRKQKRVQQRQQLQLAAKEQHRQHNMPLAPPPTADTHYRTRTAHRPHTGQYTGQASTRTNTAAANRRSSAIRAPLWTQGQGDAMLAEVSQFTLIQNREEERRKADERRAIADDEKRSREQWLADERREEREREEKEQADMERRSREQEEDELEDRERRLRYFPPQQQQQHTRYNRDRTDAIAAVRGAAESTDTRDDSEAFDHFSHTSPLPDSRSPERPQAASLSASDTLPQRRSSLAMGVARRISVTAAGGLPGLAHRRQSSLLPPSSPALSSTRTSTTNRSYRSSLATSSFPISQVRSRWQNAAGKTGKEHLARRFSLVAAHDSSQQPQQQPSHHPTKSAQQPPQSHYSHPAVSAMLPAPIDPDSSLVATNYSHDPLHSTYLQQQRQQRRTATAQVYDTVKKWLEEQEEEKRNITPVTAAGGSHSAAADRAASLSFDPQLVTPFSSILAHQPYSPRTQQRHRSMRQQLPLSVSNPAVFAWMRRHAIVPRRTIDPSEEVKVRQQQTDSSRIKAAHSTIDGCTVRVMLSVALAAVVCVCVCVVCGCVCQYRAMFNELDVDGSGLLDTGELLSALQATHNLRLSEEELHQLLTGMDIRFQGHLSFQQFVSQFASMDEWESLFRIWAKRKQKREAAAATGQPNTARSRPATSPPTDRPLSPPFRHPSVLPLVQPPVHARPSSSASLHSLRASSSSSSSSSRPSSSSTVPSTGAVTPDVDVLVPFLLWVPAFHRLQLLEALMAVQLTPEEEAAVRQSAEQQSVSASLSAADGTSGGGSGLSLLDLWRVTRTQVRRKRMESDKAEAMRIKQLQAAEGARGAIGGIGAIGAIGGKKSKGGVAAQVEDGSSAVSSEKVMEIWLELHEERERRLEVKRRWKAAHSEKRLKRTGNRSGDDSDTDGGQQRTEAFDLFKQAAQMSLDQQME